jgi:hypothetical protein
MYKIIGNNKKKYRFLCSLFAKPMPMDNKNGNPFPSGVTAGCGGYRKLLSYPVGGNLFAGVGG